MTTVSRPGRWRSWAGERSLAPKPYYGRWIVYLRGEQIGMVFAATEKAACLRSVQRYKISREDQKDLQVRTVPD
jgi:hypothetical protein